MAGGNLSPRQKMINMMYLVLIALLALNVSKEILKAFHLMETGFYKAGQNIDAKNNQAMAALQTSLSKEGDKARPFVERATKVRAESAKLIKYIEDVKQKIIKETEGRVKELEPGQPYGELTQPDNMEKHANYFVLQPNEKNNNGMALQKMINDTRTNMLQYIKPGPDAPRIPETLYTELNKNTQLYANDPKSDGGAKKTWVSMYLEHSPLAGVVALLSKIQNDCKNLESDILTNLATQINATDYKFDKLEAKVIAPSSYIMSGEKYEAEVILVAYNSKSDFQISSSAGAIPVVDGKGKYSTTVSGTGERTFSGNIMVNGPDGVVAYPFKSEYQSFLPAATISPTAMNVLYIGLDNPIAISVPGVNPSSVSASMSGGTLSPKGGGNYSARVSAPGEASINVSSGGRNMGSMKFRIKRIPNPETQLGALPPGAHPAGAIAGQSGLVCFLPNFVFDGVKYSVSKYGILIAGKKREPVVNPTNSGSSIAQYQGAIRASKSGDVVTFFNIGVVGPDGQQRMLSTSLTYQVK